MYSSMKAFVSEKRSVSLQQIKLFIIHGAYIISCLKALPILLLKLYLALNILYFPGW